MLHTTYTQFKTKLLNNLLITLLIFVSANAFVHATCLTLKEPGVLHVISYSKFQPISYGNGEGYEADLLKAAAKLWHVKIIFHPEDIYEGIWRLPSRPYTQADIAIGGITPIAYRVTEGAFFSKITVPFEQSLLVRRNDYESGRITSYQSFKNTPMKIGVVPGTTGEKYAHVQAEQNGVSQNVFVQYSSEAELLPALMRKQIDAIARGEIGNEYQAALHNQFITIAKKNFGEGFSFAVDKSNKMLINEVNHAIQKITNNGKITYSQWMKNHNVFLDRLQEDRLRSDGISYKCSV